MKAAKDRNSNEHPPEMHSAAKLSKNQTKSVPVEANQKRQPKIPMADGRVGIGIRHRGTVEEMLIARKCGR